MKQTDRLIPHLHRWSSEDLYFNGKMFFNEIISAIDNAQYSIKLECYIFYQDSLGEKIITALLNAADRAVQIKLIIDGYGSMEWSTELLKKLTDKGIEVKIYHPLPWRLSLYGQAITDTYSVNKFVYLSSRVNKRDHRKLYIIDKKLAWGGSMNISASHLNLQPEKETWFDCGVKISGESIIELSDNFDEVWKRKILYSIDNKHLPFRTNNNMLRRKHKNSEFINLIRSCSKRLWIISAYMAPSRRVVNALKQAKKNGTDVKIIISRRSDVIFFPLISTTYYAELLQAGIEIYEHKTYIIHAKTIQLDDIAFVGSSNLNHRSFLHDLELDIILARTQAINKLQNKFMQLITESDKITLSKLTRLSWYYRLLGKIIWRMRYWL